MDETSAAQQRDLLYEWIRRLRPLIYLGCAVAFIADLTRTDTGTLALGVLYIPLVATALVSSSRRTVWWLAGIANAMVVAGIFLPEINPDLFELIGNRLLSICAVMATAVYVRHAQETQRRLAEQTQRAEAAERLKTAFFANLGQDMRVPLHAIIGLSQVMKLDCPPDRRESLVHVQSATRRLLATIDNLIDLTQIDSRQLHLEQLDLRAILRRAVNESRELAAEQQVGLSLHMAEVIPDVAGDSWAAGRILENVVSNAVRFTPPGGQVTVSMLPRDCGVVVTVADTGAGIPHHVMAQLGPAAVDAGNGDAAPGTGLTLSRQLADAIGAELQLESSDSGTTVTVAFPSADRTRPARG